MKYPFFLVVTALAVFVGQHSTPPSSPQTASTAEDKSTAGSPGSTKNQDGAAETVIALAVERYNFDTARGERCILAVQDASPEVRKFTDGKITLIGLPSDVWESATDKFVSVYNDLVTLAADEQAIGGGWEQSESVYRLILKHDRRSSIKRELETRIELMQAARTNGVTNLRGKLQELEPTFKPFALIATMGTKRAAVVKDLLQVDLEQFEDVPEPKNKPEH